MNPQELEPFYGRQCSAVVFCRPCRRSHVLQGLIAPGRRSGDVVVDGVTYSSMDILSVAAEHQAQAATGLNRDWLLMLTAIGAFALWCAQYFGS